MAYGTVKFEIKYEKTADKMFEELGYEYIEHIYQYGANVYDYKNNKNDKWIRFTENDRRFIFMTQKTSTSMEELKAINKKVSELGWL